MDGLFLQIVNMSITASYVILFVIVVRWLLKKAPKIFSYVLWSVVLFRLVFPFSFESIFSFLTVSTETVPPDIMYAQTPQIDSGVAMIDRAVNLALPAPEGFASINPLQIWIPLGSFVWMLGIFVILAYSTITTIRLYRTLRGAKPLFDNVYEMCEIETPFVFGLIKPKIYLPANLRQHEQVYILKHEQTHIKRFDHIIKPIAFLIVSIHWFNPLVWIAYILMGKDMELSCDESVIQQMGNSIKQDYSASLLSLSTGKRGLGASPLAFGESNIKERILNVLRYKKPAYWVVAIAVIAVLIVGIGLSSNPKPMTVEEHAREFVEQRVDDYRNRPLLGYEIVDSQITKLEKIGSFDHLLSSTVEVWQLAYRLKPDDSNQVVLGEGMYMENGWIVEDFMGTPMLIVMHQGSVQNPNKMQYLGAVYSEADNFTTLAGQEITLRKFLEASGHLPPVTYPGNHVLVKFPLPSGEIRQLLLSQPVTQGEQGIWCVERWKDMHGNGYYVIPITEGLPLDYYRQLQQSVDGGNQQSLRDPVQVALDFINNVDNDNGLIANLNVSEDQLEIQYGATVEDFARSLESRFIGYVANFQFATLSFHLDPVEWLTTADRDRLREIDVDPNELLNGYYIYNKETYPMYCEVNEKTKYNIIDGNGLTSHKAVTKDELVQYLDQHADYSPLFWITIQDGYVTDMSEQYRP